MISTMYSSVCRNEAPPTRKQWFALYLAIALVYVLTSSGRIGGSDALAMARVSQSLANEGTLSADPCIPGPESVHCVPGVDGKHYAAYGLAPSFLAIPVTPIVSVLAAIVHKNPELLFGFVLAVYQALFAGAVPLILALWLHRIGISWHATSLTAFIYAFASPAWSFARGFYSEPYFALGLLACCYFLCAEPEPIPILAAGACFGFACGSRVYGLILLPVVFLYAFLLWRSKQAAVSTIVRNLSLLSVPIVVTIALIALSNQLRFGSIFKTGYHLLNPNVASLLSTPLWGGMRSLLFDGEVGILYYVPWILALPFLWRPFWRNYRTEAILVLGLSLTNFLFFAKYTAWHGGWSIGPRLLNAVVPFLTLILAVAIHEGRLASWTLVKRIVVVLVCAAFIIQLILLPYPVSRYFHMQYYNSQHGIQQPWWNGQPLLAAIASYPELFFGKATAHNSLAYQYLLTFPNRVNLVRADLWLLKASLLGFPAVASLAFGAVVLIVAAYNMRTALLFSSAPSDAPACQTEVH